MSNTMELARSALTAARQAVAEGDTETAVRALKNHDAAIRALITSTHDPAELTALYEEQRSLMAEWNATLECLRSLLTGTRRGATAAKAYLTGATG